VGVLEEKLDSNNKPVLLGSEILFSLEPERVNNVKPSITVISSMNALRQVYEVDLFLVGKRLILRGGILNLKTIVQGSSHHLHQRVYTRSYRN